MILMAQPTKKSRMNLYITIAVIIIIIAVAALIYWTYFMPQNTFTASLSSGKVLPPTGSSATGTATFTLSSDGNTLHYVLTVNSLNNIIAAHIHLATASQNGSVIVPLFTGPAKTGSFSGTLVEGDITAANLAGSLAGHPLSDLIDDIKNSMCYVNVHTTAFPAGEIRGQIQVG